MTGRLSEFTHESMAFEVTDVGARDGEVVVMLHGFPEDRHCWSGLSASLTEAGHRVLAPDQRGYSPGARPVARRAYALERLCSDVLALADEAGSERFHLVGHDWGAVVAWSLAASYPERIRTLCALSVPHPRAFLESFWRSSQALRSWYMAFFQLPAIPERLLAARGGRGLASGLERSGLDAPSAERYAARSANVAGITAPVNWYRGIPFGSRGLPGVVSIPTLFVWGDRERFVSRVAAERCRLWVAGHYRFEILPGKTHWLPTTAAGEIAPLLVDHLSTARRSP